ncbi:MAG: DnaB-like helicase C-terminal domain-containing protein [Phycisphaerae bacterium]|nr:DnaB-like helicase C-terminal domain-containing protein [Phycisphaerae bacterium]MDD5239966.1 DnaB-like helicase C-terminal domain-containing protein [Candidatus Nanoarchaeia archaeon]
MYPNNTDLEKSVLGCLFSEKLDHIIELCENDFHNESNRLIFKTISYMYEKHMPVDEVTVSDKLKKRIDNVLEYITSFQSFVSSPENIGHYMEFLKTYTMRREILKAAEKAKTVALDDNHENALCLKNDVQQMFDIKTRDRQKNDGKINVIVGRAVRDMEIKSTEKNESKLFIGFYELDRITAGLHPEELTLIAARPGVGKTAFALQLMINLARKENCCLFVSREMSCMQIAKRLIANISDVDGQKLRYCKSLDVKDWGKIGEAQEFLEILPIEINDRLSTVQEIRAYCRELKNKGQLDLLIVDYLQLCKSLKKTENRRQEIEDISRQLKEMSSEFAIPVIALSQLSRESVTGEPELHHLRESGSLEQDADNVIFLHIPKDTNEHADIFEIKVIVAKQRNGPTGYIMLRYYRRTFKLCNLL